MEESDLLSEINTRRKELEEALVNAGNDLAEDNKIRGKILGLDEAKGIIHEIYIRFNDGDRTASDTIE